MFLSSLSLSLCSAQNFFLEIFAMKFVGSLCSKMPSSTAREKTARGALKKDQCPDSKNFTIKPSSFSSSSSSFDSLSTPKTVLPLSSSGRLSRSARFSASGSFKITKDELEVALRRLGPDPLTDKEVASMVAEIECDSDGCISLGELDAMGSSSGELVVEMKSDRGEMRDVFRVFDADGDGKISAEELMRVFLALGDEECGIEECRRMIKGVDSTGDGFVCFQDFARMMTMMEGQR